MKEIRIKKLCIKNFKGCRNAEIEFGKETCIYGANAAGKTTIYDAFTWLLFGKDSHGAEKFNIRPLYANGEMVNNVEIVVGCDLDIDGKETTLKKVQKQKWVKRRGTDVTELQGNVNEMEINGYPASESEYKKFISEIVEESAFKLLTDTKAFASLPWKKQRGVLLQLVSEVTDEDVLQESEEKFESIRNDIGEATIDKCLEKAKKIMSKLKENQKELPTRIDEANKSLMEIPDLAEMELQRNALTEQLADVQNQRDDVSQSYRAVEDLQEEILAIQKSITGMEQAAHDGLNQRRRDARKLYDEASKRRNDLFREKDIIAAGIARIEKDIKHIEEDRLELGKQWKAAKASTMDESDTICQACGQLLPEDKAQEIIAGFEKRKQERIDSITKSGNNAKGNIADRKAKIEKLNIELESTKEEWTKAMQETSRLYTAMQEVPDKIDISDLPEYAEKIAGVESLKKKLASMDSGEAIRMQLSERDVKIRSELNAVNRKFAEAEAAEEMNARTQDRLKELQSEQKDIGQKVADQEKKVFLLEEFQRAKMDLLSSKVNQKFNVVEFKLFEMQINGGMKDTCEMMINGVPYSAGLNAAAQVQAGMEMIQALSELYDVSVPVWIDNRESITEIPAVDSQVINLVVSPKDKILRVEGN